MTLRKLTMWALPKSLDRRHGINDGIWAMFDSEEDASYSRQDPRQIPVEVEVVVTVKSKTSANDGIEAPKRNGGRLE